MLILGRMTDSAEPTPSPATVQATVVLRRRGSDSPPVGLRRRITAAELGEKYGAHPDDVAAVRRLLADRGAEVLEEHGSSRRLRVQGTADALAGLEDDDRVAAVLGLDEGPLARPRAIIADPTATKVSYTPLQLADAYGMPDGDGTGQTIAIVELGGGFAQDDLDHYFSGLGLKSPTVRAVGVDGAKNQPGKDPQGADVEVLLDIEVVGAIAPRAEIVVYFAPNSDAGFVDAISTAAEADPTPAAISISWGQSEDQWKARSRQAMDSAIADATSLGVTVTAAAGDNGSADRDTSGGRVHTDFPASSPHALGCGGTTLQLDGDTVSSETVWDDGGKGGATGGGVSDVFELPDWQRDAGVPRRHGSSDTGRGVPDVAGDADPQTGYQVYADGKQIVVGGTSAVAPLWAGLLARVAQQTGQPIGLAQPALYAGARPGEPAPGLRDITKGNNGAYHAGPGWDACTGLGVPTSNLLDTLQGQDG